MVLMAAKRLRGASVISSVDSQGLLIEVLVTVANLSERLGGSVLVMEALPQIPNLELLWDDLGYSGPHFTQAIATLTQARVEVIKGVGKGFEILPRRWVVERTKAWLVQNRRLVVDYEQLPEMSETMIYAAMTRLMLRRLARLRQIS